MLEKKETKTENFIETKGTLMLRKPPRNETSMTLAQPVLDRIGEIIECIGLSVVVACPSKSSAPEVFPSVSRGRGAAETRPRKFGQSREHPSINVSLPHVPAASVQRGRMVA